jgi:hypothetical protein
MLVWVRISGVSGEVGQGWQGWQGKVVPGYARWDGYDGFQMAMPKKSKI